MTADRNALMRTTILAGGLLLAALAPAAAAEPPAAPAAPATLEPALIDQHVQVVAAVVKSQLSPVVTPEDQRRTLALIKSLLDQRKATRSDQAGRPLLPLTRREAVVRGLETNLSLAIGRPEPDRAQTVLREAQAVFDPVLDLQLGYNRKDSYTRTRVGLVRPKSFVPVIGPAAGGETISSTNPPTANDLDPLNPVGGPPLPGFRRLNFCTATQGLGCQPTTQPVIRALEFYQNTNKTPVFDTITANGGRATLNKGHPLQQVNVSVGLSQELPWGGTVQLTDNTIQQKIYYESRHYWEDGQYTTNLSGTFTSPVPYGKGFGPDNPHNAAIQSARISREQADWTLKDLVNSTLRDVDLAYFEVVRQLEALESTVKNRESIIQLQERQNRMIKQDPGLVTRYQEAQINNEVSKAGIQVEQALQNYLSASVSLASLIGDPDARSGSAIYLPYAYGRDLNTPLAVNLDGALATARVNRPDFHVVALGRDSAEVNRRLAENQARPDIQVSASVNANENGSTYGYSNPYQSTMALGQPDSVNQNYGVTYTRPWGNRAAIAAVDIARLSVEDQEIVIRDTDSRVKREITTDLATVQSARARLTHSEAQAKSLRSAYESLGRQLEAGLVGEDQIISASRNLLSAELARISAKIDNREAETVLLYAQGTIANVLPGQTAQSPLDERRVALLADSGTLKYFGPAKK